MTEPTWGTAARLDGIGLRGEGSKWQRGAIAVVGSLADCIARWLELPGFKQRGCWLDWGYAYDGVHGRMEPEAISAYVLKHGLPAHVAGALGGQPPQTDLKWIVAMPRFDHEPTLTTYKTALERAAATTSFLSAIGAATISSVCNLYSITSNQAAMRELAKAIRDMTGNFEPLPAVFPDRMAPVVRVAPDGVRELVMMRWGFPPPNIPGSKPRNPYLTNVRNTNSSYWKPWLKKPEQRCLVPATSFAEPDNNQGPRSIWTWFAQDESRPLMFFAGIWREWEGSRGTKANPTTGNHLVFSFLTTDASRDVAPVHSDATPVLLLSEDEREMWMNGPVEIALSLQRPPPPGSLKVVATDTKEDEVINVQK